MQGFGETTRSAELMNCVKMAAEKIEPFSPTGKLSLQVVLLGLSQPSPLSDLISPSSSSNAEQPEEISSESCLTDTFLSTFLLFGEATRGHFCIAIEFVELFLSGKKIERLGETSFFLRPHTSQILNNYT